MPGCKARPSKTRETYVAYRKAGYSRKFYAEHEDEIRLHRAAKEAFNELNVKKLPTMKALQAEYAQLLADKKKAYGEYRRARAEMRELLAVKANVDRILNWEASQEAEQQKDPGQRSLNKQRQGAVATYRSHGQHKKPLHGGPVFSTHLF